MSLPGAVAYQIRKYYQDNTVTPGWQEWEMVTKEKYEEIIQYIEHGYLYYQVRILIPEAAICHKLSPPDDCPGLSREGTAKNFEANPFAFRK